MFISEYKADENIRNKIRTTTLDTAEYGADEGGTDKGKASLHAAVEEGDIDAVKVSLRRGIDINSRNSHNETPLHLAADRGTSMLYVCSSSGARRWIHVRCLGGRRYTMHQMWTPRSLASAQRL